MTRFPRLTRALALTALLAAGPALAQTPAPSTPTTRPAPTVPAPTATPPAAPTAPKAPEAPKAAAPATQAAPSAKPVLIDLNTASKQELETLKGIGTARSEAIIKGRPYRGKDELLSKKIVPSNVYEDIKDKVIARQKS
ncbi:helix-hairpin-helix domain-containing protein [Methylobacterium terricola]|uniref:Helix-hairpin-helix domain-containing protein n=1 Tax=Methylobacterium terricola TaxID=2583531 RepID=A0A5C4LDQ0_9HYPH|nr:helix-hairpin-helix domain-containing protein [Methylobacterium terricola]TNC10547.1 helix-hairpin-helix domain-containing protein [Methylobacterium terricola]